MIVNLLEMHHMKQPHQTNDGNCFAAKLEQRHCKSQVLVHAAVTRKSASNSQTCQPADLTELHAAPPLQSAATGVLRLCQRLLPYKPEAAEPLLRGLQLVPSLDPEVSCCMKQRCVSSFPMHHIVCCGILPSSCSCSHVISTPC